MGFLVKSEEQKEQEEFEKLQKEEEKIKKALRALGVDFDSYSDREIKEVNKKTFGFIGSTIPLDAAGEILSSFGLNNYQRISLGKLITLIHQNWILIRQNELIIRRLEKILNASANKSK